MYLFGLHFYVKGTEAIRIIEGGSPGIETFRLSFTLIGREMIAPST
jgi:hypothetical protein